jgi:hypothetical protein
MSQGENAYLVLRGVFHVSPPALGGLSIDGKLTFSSEQVDGDSVRDGLISLGLTVQTSSSLRWGYTPAHE